MNAPEVATGDGSRHDSEDAGPPKLLLFANGVAMGGMEEHVRLLARDIDRSQFEVWAAAPDWELTQRFVTGLVGAADHVVQSTPDRRHGVWRQLVETWRLFRLCRRERFAVAHLHSTSYQGLTMAVIAIRLAGTRRVFITEHLAPERPVPWLPRWTRRAVFRSVSGLVCVSENNRESRARFLGTPPGRTFVVNNGIDVQAFDPVGDLEEMRALRTALAVPEGAPVVGTAIRFEPGKGVEYLIDAFAHVRATHPTAVLLMVGDGSLRSDLELRSADRGVADAVRFVGFQADPKPYILLMDAFVLPVPFGSASIALLEAMAMERACVITFGGDREAVVHGVSGLCARPGDPSSIAECLNSLLDYPDMAEDIGHQARARVESDYSALRVAEQLTRIYRGR